jgi:hypothetical protein
LYRRMYLAYAQIYRATDPDTAAAWLKRAEEMDSRAGREQFSNEMMASLGSLMDLFNKKKGS